MKEKIEVVNPYNEEHISMFQAYEEKNKLPNTISSNLQKTKNILTESEYRQLELELPEVNKILFISQNKNIMAVAHLLEEKDRKICRIIMDKATNIKFKEKLLIEAENYVFTNLGMEDIVFLQEENGQLSSNYLKKQGFDDLGTESQMQVYTKSKEINKKAAYQM